LKYGLVDSSETSQNLGNMYFNPFREIYTKSIKFIQSTNIYWLAKK
jgi:hypothetical protein